MNLVIDTNVLISGIFWGGIPYKILKFWIQGKYQVIFTVETLNECVRVLKEIGSRRDLKLIEGWITFICQNGILVQNINNLAICRDKFDDAFVNSALSGHAKYIVTGDKDLLSLCKVSNVCILTPKQFIEVARSKNA